MSAMKKQVSMDFVRERIIENLFLQFNGTRPKLQARLEEEYRKRYNAKIPVIDNIRAVYLEGKPGHGKTTIHREACREFATIMGMQFFDEPGKEDLASGAIKDDSFVFSVLTVAGATAKHEVGGLVAKTKVGNNEYMTHLPDWRLAATMQGGFGYVFFDDFTTAAYQAQSAALDLLLGGSVGEINLKSLNASKVKFDQTGQLVAEYDPEQAAQVSSLEGGKRRTASYLMVGLAGNRGTSDGNKTFPRTTATTNRVHMMEPIDDYKSFSNRATNRCNDENGDCQYGTMLMRFPELFDAMPKPVDGNIPPYCSPRSHDSALDMVRVIINRFGGMDSLAKDPNAQMKAVQEIEDNLAGLIGDQYEPMEKIEGMPTITPAQTVASFYQDLFMGAYPEAQRLIVEGEFRQADIEAAYQGGQNGTGKTYGYQFAQAIAELSGNKVAEIIQSKKHKSRDSMLKDFSDENSPMSMEIRKVMANYSKGLNCLTPDFVNWSLDRFNRRLANRAENLFEAGAYKVPPKETMRTMMFGMIKDNDKNMKESLIDTFVDAISQNFGINGAMSNFQTKQISDHLATVRENTKKAAADAKNKAKML